MLANVRERRVTRREANALGLVENERADFEKARKALNENVATPAQRSYMKGLLKRELKTSGDKVEQYLSPAEKKLINFDVVQTARDKFSSGDKLSRKESKALKKNIQERFDQGKNLYGEAKKNFENDVDELRFAGILEKAGKTGLTARQTRREMRETYPEDYTLLSRFGINISGTSLFLIICLLIFLVALIIYAVNQSKENQRKKGSDKPN